MLEWNLVKGSQEVQQDYISLATFVNVICRVHHDDQLCFIGMPLAETVLSISDDIIPV